MALQSLIGGMWIPEFHYFSGTAVPGFATSGPLLIDADGEKAAFIFRCPKAGDLSRVRIRFGTVTKGANTDVKVSLQDVDATTGNPDGAVDQYRLIGTANIASDTVVRTGLLTSDGTDGGTVRTVTRGQLLACVIEYSTFNASDSIVVNTLLAGTRQDSFYYEYGDLYTSSWAKHTGGGCLLTLEYSDGSSAYCPGVFPAISAGSSQSYANNSNPNVYGLKFRVPFPCKLGGLWAGLDADGNFDAVLYTPSGSSTLLSADKDVRSSSTGHVSLLLFDSEQTLSKDTDYILAIKPTTTTSLALGYLDVTAAAELDQLGGGQAFHWASANNPTVAGDFSATTTRRPMLGIMVSACDDAVSAGGGGFPILGGSIVR